MTMYFGIRKENEEFVLEFNPEGIPTSDTYNPKTTKRALKVFEHAGIKAENLSNNMYVVPEGAVASLVVGFQKAGFTLCQELHTIGEVQNTQQPTSKVVVPKERHMTPPSVLCGVPRITALSSWVEIYAWHHQMIQLGGEGRIKGTDIIRDFRTALEHYNEYSPAGREAAANPKAAMSVHGVQSWADTVGKEVSIAKLTIELPFIQNLSEMRSQFNWKSIRPEWEKSADMVAENIGRIASRLTDIGTSYQQTDVFVQAGRNWCVPHNTRSLSVFKLLYDVHSGKEGYKENNLPIELTSPFGLKGSELGQPIDCDYPFEVIITKSGAARVSFTNEQAKVINEAKKTLISKAAPQPIESLTAGPQHKQSGADPTLTNSKIR